MQVQGWARPLRRSIRSLADRWKTDRLVRIPSFAILGTAVLILGIAFVWHALHFFGAIPHPLPPMLAPWEEGTLPEAIEGAAMLLAVALLLFAAIRERAPVLWAWAGIIAVLAADNLLGLHEHLGHAGAARLGSFNIGPIGAHNLVELVVLGVGGLVLLAVLIAAGWASGPRARETSALLLAITLALAFFAVVVDAVGVVTASRLVAFVEDGGELLLLAGLACVCLAIARTATTGSADVGADVGIRG